MQKRCSNSNSRSSKSSHRNDTECNFVQSVIYCCHAQLKLAAQLRCCLSHALSSVLLYVKDHSGCFLQVYNVLLLLLLLLLLLFLLALIAIVE
jgi:hypothetical protein